MPRNSRHLIAGNLFIHNMVQGINREYIFENYMQKNKYISLVKKYSEKYHILLIAYCIMDNHAHLLTYSEKIENISLFMKAVNSKYALYYNKSNNRIGFVFRNRFTSKIIYNQEYLLKCIKYIHMNPVKSQIVKREEEYEFSSYKEYLNKNGIVNSKLLEIVFNKQQQYIDILKSVKYQPLNLEKEQIDLSEALQKFLIQENLKLSQIQKNSLLIKKFISYLISNEYDFRKQDIAIILKISRAKMYRKLKENKQ